MKNLRVIEKELVPVYETSTGESVVYGTELHAVLQVKSRFNDWVHNRLEDCEAVENEDFQVLTKNLVNGGRSKEYIIKLDTAKEMAMLERNEKGKQVRRYFIEVEKRYKAGLYQTPDEKIAILAQGHIELKERLEKKIDGVRNELHEYMQNLPLTGIECDMLTRAIHKRGVDVLGGKNSNAYKDQSIRGKVYQDIHKELKRQFDVPSYKAISRSQCCLAIKVAEKYEPPVVLKEKIKKSNAK